MNLTLILSLFYLGHPRRHWLTRTRWLSRPKGKDSPEVGFSTVDSSPSYLFLLAGFYAMQSIKPGFFLFFSFLSIYNLSILHLFPFLTSSMSITFIKIWKLSSNLPKLATPLSEGSHNLNTLCTELYVLVE